MTFKWSFLLLAGGFATVANASENLTPLKVQIPSVLSRSSDLGPLPSSQQLHVTISLPPAYPTAFEAYANAVSNPKSPYYRHFLTPAQVGANFGQPTTNVQSVVSFLKGSGFQVKLVAANRLTILTDCTAAQAEAAFHTPIHQFQSHDSSDIDQSEFYSYTSNLQVPQSIAPWILSVDGLQSHTRAHPLFKRIKQSAQNPLSPQQASVLYDLTTLQSNGYTGTGINVGISSWDGFELSNVTLFYKEFSLPTPPGGVLSNVTVEKINGGATGGGQGEGDLDMQMVLGQAPLCNVIVYDDGDSSDLLGVLTQEVNDNSVNVITESYGWGSDSDTFYQSAHNEHLSMTSQGITYSASSGDDGANFQTAPYPDFEPEVTVVGGTAPNTTSTGSRISEPAWSDGGGGWMTWSDTINVKPSWQIGTGVPTALNVRYFPDIALAAGGPSSGQPWAFLFVHDGSDKYEASGTSCASPLFMGSLADVEQFLIANGSLPPNAAGNQRLGRINDFLYSLNGNASVFYDVTTGSNGTLPNGSPSNAGVGWDTATGWGAPDFGGLANALSDSVVSTVSFAPSSIDGGTSVTGTVTLTGITLTGVSVNLASNNSSVGVPSSVTVPAGSSSGTFTVTTKASSVSFSALVTATYNKVSVQGSLNVLGDAVASVSLNPASVAGGSASTGTVTLKLAAPTGGWTVSLGSQYPTSVGVPSSIVIAAGSTTGTFPITTVVYIKTYTNNIEASDMTSDKVATLTVIGNPLTLTLSPTTVTGGTSSTGTVTLPTAATSNEIVTLGSQYPTSVGVPASVTIPTGQTSATFTVTTLLYPTSYTDYIDATYMGATKSAQLTILGHLLSTLTLSPSTVVGGTNSTGTVTLSGPAPSGGVTVTLGSQYASSVGVPASVTIAAGHTSATFSITTKLYSSSYTNYIEASYSGTTLSTKLTVTS